MKLKYQSEMFELTTSTNTDSKAIDANHFKIYHSGRLVSCYATEDANNIYVFIEGNSFHFEKVNEEEDFSSESSNNANRLEVKAPMPGSVVKVVVGPGQEVAEGDALIIVEAMKMETSLFSTISGTVSEVNVKEGEQVDSSKVLIVVEKNSPNLP